MLVGSRSPVIECRAVVAAINTMIQIRRLAGRATAWLIVAAAASFYFIWSHTDQIGLVTGDASSYLMMAETYAHAGRDQVMADAASASRFPPLYPLLLARLGGAENLPWAHAITTTCLLLALAILFFWMRREGLGSVPAGLLVLATAAVPDVWLAALTIQSEYLYILLSLAALAILARHENDHRTEPLFLAALLVALAILTRSAGIALLVPLLASLRRRSWRERLLAGLLTLAPLLLWHSLHHAGHGYFSSVRESLAYRVTTDPAGFISQQFFGLRHGLQIALLLQPQWLNPLVDILGVVCLLATAVRCATLQPDALYVAAYLLMLLLWPYPGDAHRLLWPVFPVLFVQPALAFASGPWRERRIPVLVATMVATLALPSILLAVDRYRDPATESLPEIRADPLWYWPQRDTALRFAAAEATLLQALQKLPRFVGENECVLSTRPEWVNFFSRRRSEGPPPAGAPDSALAASLKTCSLVFMTPFNDRGYPDPMYPLARLGMDVEVLDYTYSADPAEPGKRIEFLLVRTGSRSVGQ